jgi:hypothetical protein
MTANKVDYATYRDRFCERHGGDHGQKVRKAASRALEVLRDKHQAIDWPGSEEPIIILDGLWTLAPSAMGQ